MVAFWKWFVCTPAFLAGAVALLAGATDVTGWPLAIAGAAVAGIVFDIAWHFVRIGERARRRRAERLEAQEARRRAEAARAAAEAAQQRLAGWVGDHEEAA